MSTTRFVLLAITTSLIFGAVGCGGSGGPSGPTPTILALVNARPVFDDAAPLTIRPNTWLAGVPVRTDIHGTDFEPGVAELFYDTALGTGTPIGGGVLMAEPLPGAGTRTETATDINGWSPAAAGLAADTPTTLRVRNPGGNFSERNGLTWARTGALTNQNVSARAGQDVDISIAVNPNATALGLAPGSNAAMVWATSLTGFGGTAIFASHTTDFGRTWSLPMDIGPSDGLAPGNHRSQPHCAFDRFGNLRIFWLTQDAVGSVDRLGTAGSTDGGATFSAGGFLGVFGPPVGATSHISNLATGINNGAFAPGGSIFFFATVTNIVGVEVFNVEQSALGSPVLAGAAAPGPINDVPAAYADVGAAVGPSGEFVVTWTESFVPPTGATFIYQDIDIDGLGAPGTFGPDHTVATPSFPSSTAPIPSQPLFPGVGTRPVPAVIRTGPHAGRIVVAYHGVNEVTYATPPGDNDIFSTFSDNGGVTWSVPITVHPPSTNDQSYPWLDADPFSGTLYVTWCSTANHVGNSRNQRFSAASTTGASWSAPMLLSQGASDAALLGGGTNGYSQYAGHSAWRGFVYAAWPDNANVQLLPPIPAITPNPDNHAQMDAYATVYMQAP